MASESIGSVLVVGGCGFLAGASYYACDISDINSLRKTLLAIRPRIILHTASPIFYEDKINKFLLHQINVIGTQNLLDVAKTTESVKAFIYTSSSSVHAGSDFQFITEEAPLLGRSSKADEYAITKAIADSLVLSANCPELRTICLRPTAIYGERDNQLIPGSLAVLRDKKTNIQLGDNRNLYDSIYVGNAASAHFLAAKALLKDASDFKVDGEAFFVTDDNPMPFWDFQRMIWAAAGDKTTLSKIQVIPAWVGMAMATVVEYLVGVFTLGQRLPPKTLRRDVLQYVVTNRTFRIKKAKERLGYKPLVDTSDGIKRGVEWALQNQNKKLGTASKE